MSLLNDALRAAEQRQNRPGVTGAYTGQPRPDHGPSRWRPVVILAFSIALIALAVYWYMTSTAAEPVVAASIPTPTPVPESQTASAPGPDPQSVPTSATETTATAESSTVPMADPQKVPVAQSEEPPTAEAAALPIAQTGNRSTVESRQAPVRDLALTPGAQAEAPPGPRAEAPVPSVKQVRETPEAIDRRVSRQLASLLGNGQTREAERQLRSLVEAQTAVASRAVFARHMLVQGMPGQALAWLPETVAMADSGLRLLRARALLAVGDLDGALATLQSRVPALAGNIEYRVTLATLLQQAGRSAESARHWSLLIAQDDSRAAWWVGLAIALEAGGETGSAVRAYAQAAQLPGLSPSLADYVRERLRSLQAG